MRSWASWDRRGAGVVSGFGFGGIGGVDVLRDVSLSIEKGAFTVFVGPSGGGKSTLLRYDPRRSDRGAAGRAD